MEEAVVTGVTHDRAQAKVTILRVPDRPGIASQVFGGLGGQNIVVDMIVQNISREGLTDISFTLPRGDRQRARARARPASPRRSAPRASWPTTAWPRSRSSAWACAATPAWRGRMFATLSKEGINIQMISTSEIAVSCVIEDKYTELAVRALHDAFELGRDRA